MEKGSILNDVKHMLGLEPCYTPFDSEIILHINSALTVLHQLGVGKDMLISGEEETWADLFGEEGPIQLTKSYLFLKTKLLFDPPNSGVLHEAMERQVQEFEWRLNVQAETRI